MHTIIILAVSFAVLGLCLLLGSIIGGASVTRATAALLFVPLWFLGAGLNMWFGVAKAGYTLKEELPIFLLIFTLPASVALALWWKLKAHATTTR